MGENSGLTIHELIQLLPYRLRSRFESLSHYVRVVIREEVQRERDQRTRGRRSEDFASDRVLPRVTSADIQLIQLIVLIYALDQLFVEGTQAAQGAVDRFSSLRMDGFVLGRAEFVGRNENVMRGQALSDALRESIRNPRLLRLLKSARGIKSLVLAVMGELRNGQSVD